MENMEVMEQEQSQTYEYDEKDYPPVDEENGQVPDGDQTDQPENEKTFTQDEVNQIIQKRLDRERQKNELRNNPDEFIKSLEEREEQVLKRELRYKADVMRADKEDNYCMQPKGLLEFLDYSSEEAMESSFEKFQELVLLPIYRAHLKREARGSAPKVGTGGGWGEYHQSQRIEDAFKPEK